MDRDSTGTQLNFNSAGPADLIPRASPSPSSDPALQSTNESRPAVPTKHVADELEKKRKRPVEDEGRNDAKSRFPKLLASRFQKPKASAEADNGDHPQGTNTVAAKALPDNNSLNKLHDVSASTRPQFQPFVLPLTVKDESPWKTYTKEHQIELGGLVTVAERKHPAYGLVVVKEFSGPSAENKLSMLRHIPEIVQTSYFVSCVEVFHFENVLHVVSEHMTISLLQIVAAPRYPRENHVAAIIGQILGGIEFLESHKLVYGDLTCSSVLVNQEGVVKIANHECCRTATPEDRRDHPDSQALGDIMMQLIEKRNRRNGTIGADDLYRWSPTVAGFLSETMSASAKELAQHAFLQSKWRKEDLLSLISLAQIASRRQYKVEQ